MPEIIFARADGSSTMVTARIGDSVMETAINNGVAGIVAECGGAMMCATCHCMVDAQWTSATGSRNPGEDEMLECAAVPPTATSRLSCQIRMTDALDGLVVHLPASQI